MAPTTPSTVSTGISTALDTGNLSNTHRLSGLYPCRLMTLVINLAWLTRHPMNPLTFLKLHSMPSQRCVQISLNLTQLLISLHTQSDQGQHTLPTLALIDSNGDSDSDNEIAEWSDADPDDANFNPGDLLFTQSASNEWYPWQSKVVSSFATSRLLSTTSNVLC